MAIDISTKAQILHNNKDFHLKHFGVAHPSLQSLVLKEVELKVTDFNVDK